MFKMKKLIIKIIVSVIFLSGLANASDVIVELRVHYLYSSEEAFRDICGGGMIIELRTLLDRRKSGKYIDTAQYFEGVQISRILNREKEEIL